MKRNTLIVAFLSVLLIFAVSCSKSSSSSSSTTSTSSTTASTPAAPSTGVKITLLNSKGEVQAGLEEIAKVYKNETGVDLEIIACGAGEVPYTKITTMYNSGNAPTMAMLDATDILALAETYAVDLSGERWVAENEGTVMRVNGTLYSFPFCIEGRGIIYNKEAIERYTGETFDPESIRSYDDFAALLQKIRNGGNQYPVFISMEDWSLGAHQLGYVYDTYDGTTAGSEIAIQMLEDGTDPNTMPRFNEFVQTFDLLMEYNYAHRDPLAADYDEGALLLADGTVCFWSNGNWAWPNLAEGGAETDQEFGFLPFFMGNDESDFANNSMQAGATKQVMIDKVQATAAQQQAAKDFLNWLVYNENGQRLLTEACAIIPSSTNNPFQPADPLGRSIVEHMADGRTYSSMFIAPSDHWSVMGAAMQKYLAGRSSKAELANELSAYWVKQK